MINLRFCINSHLLFTSPPFYSLSLSLWLILFWMNAPLFFRSKGTQKTPKYWRFSPTRHPSARRSPGSSTSSPWLKGWGRSLLKSLRYLWKDFFMRDTYSGKIFAFVCIDYLRLYWTNFPSLSLSRNLNSNPSSSLSPHTYDDVTQGGCAVVSVFLWEDFRSPKKRARFERWFPFDRILMLTSSPEEDVEAREFLGGESMWEVKTWFRVTKGEGRRRDERNGRKDHLICWMRSEEFHWFFDWDLERNREISVTIHRIQKVDWHSLSSYATLILVHHVILHTPHIRLYESFLSHTSHPCCHTTFALPQISASWTRTIFRFDFK